MKQPNRDMFYPLSRPNPIRVIRSHNPLTAPIPTPIPRTSNLKPQTSNLKPQTSNLKPRPERSKIQNPTHPAPNLL
jgi:hypothetical protein